MTQITFKNNPIHLVGSEVSEGQHAPDFKVLDNDLNEVSLENYKGQKKLITLYLLLIQVCVTNKLVNLMKKRRKKTVLF